MCVQDLSLQLQENKGDKILHYHDFHYAQAYVSSKDGKANICQEASLPLASHAFE